jgi:hypothetical protein
LARNGSGDGRRRGRRRSAATAAMPATGGSAGPCTCTGGSKGCGWMLRRRLGSSRGGGWWGAPASSARWRRRARRSGAVRRPSKCEGGGVHGASGEPKGAHYSQVVSASWARAWGRNAWLWRRRAHSATRPLATRARACGRKAVARPQETGAWSSP